jgi:hypothetical protein
MIQSCFLTSDPNHGPFCCGYTTGGNQGVPDVGVDVTLDFHTYGCELDFTAGTLKVYFDGTQVWSYSGSTPAQAYEIIVNMQAWSTGLGWASGYTGDTGSFLIAEIQAYAA